MKINDVVYQNYHGIRRYGVVNQVEVHGDGWTYAGVRWIDDDKYERAMEDLSRYRGGDHTKNSYRVDEVTVIDAQKEVKALTKCMWWAENKEQKS